MEESVNLHRNSIKSDGPPMPEKLETNLKWGARSNGEKVGVLLERKVL